ncbi:Ribosome-releasing factor 2, mitochondrial [Frankliniella fusca]|uniref:Ribosome-releasing factor 2, mitochondrial n=1 Tax=Frankliniella fusca TaxID=407009 RepID=A0AAE1GWY9_9NEOP|nr:Ribosome-releasing factor 2, mitochondrial [Frankliniella fusca]
MFAVNSVRRAAVAAVRREGCKRNSSAYCDVVATPPTNKVSSAEMWVQAAVLTAGILGYPIYATFEVAEHKRAEYAEYEIPENWQAWKERQNK